MMRLMIPDPAKLYGAFCLRDQVSADITGKAMSLTNPVPIGDGLTGGPGKASVEADAIARLSD